MKTRLSFASIVLALCLSTVCTASPQHFPQKIFVLTTDLIVEEVREELRQKLEELADADLEQRKQLQSSLKSALKNYYETKLGLQEQKLAAVKEKVELMSVQLEARSKSSGEMVELRLKQFVQQAEAGELDVSQELRELWSANPNAPLVYLSEPDPSVSDETNLADPNPSDAGDSYLAEPEPTLSDPDISYSPINRQLIGKVSTPDEESIDRLLDRRIEGYLKDRKELKRPLTIESIDEVRAKAWQGIEIPKLSPRQLHKMLKRGLLQFEEAAEVAKGVLKKRVNDPGEQGVVARYLLVELCIDQYGNVSPELERRVVSLLEHPNLAKAVRSNPQVQVFATLANFKSVKDVWNQYRTELIALHDAILEPHSERFLELQSCMQILNSVAKPEDSETLQNIRQKLIPSAKKIVTLIELGDSSGGDFYLSAAQGQVTMLESAEAVTGTLIGSPAKELNVVWSNNTNLKSWDDLKGKAFVLDFWTTNCGHCVKNFPELKKLQQRLPDSVQLIGVSSPQGMVYLKNGLVDCEGDTEKEFSFMNQYFLEKDVTWPNVFVDNIYTSGYGVRAVPEMIVVDEKGIIRDSFRPTLETVDELEARIKLALSDENR